MASPGYVLRSLTSTTYLTFQDTPLSVLKAYASTGEGLDKAGGFALQGVGMPLVKSIEGEWGNVVGFGASAFLKCVSLSLPLSLSPPRPGSSISFFSPSSVFLRQKSIDTHPSLRFGLASWKRWMGDLLDDPAEDLLEL